MTKQEEKEAQIFLESVAAMAKSLALQLERGTLWEGEFDQQLSQIKSHLKKAGENSRFGSL